MNLKSVNAIATAGLVLPAGGGSGSGKAGKNCTIQSVVDIPGGKRITFAWSSDAGAATTTSIDVMDGKSAYEIAVENGYPGTEAEWAEQLSDLSIYAKQSSIITINEALIRHQSSITTIEEALRNLDPSEGIEGVPMDVVQGWFS